MMRNHCTMPSFVPQGQPYIPCFHSMYDDVTMFHLISYINSLFLLDVLFFQILK